MGCRSGDAEGHGSGQLIRHLPQLPFALSLSEAELSLLNGRFSFLVQHVPHEKAVLRQAQHERVWNGVR
jgi:hypothetical protein